MNAPTSLRAYRVRFTVCGPLREWTRYSESYDKAVASAHHALRAEFPAGYLLLSVREVSA